MVGWPRLDNFSLELLSIAQNLDGLIKVNSVVI